jgi:hypothetical protein
MVARWKAGCGSVVGSAACSSEFADPVASKLATNLLEVAMARASGIGRDLRYGRVADRQPDPSKKSARPANANAIEVAADLGLPVDGGRHSVVTEDP